MSDRLKRTRNSDPRRITVNLTVEMFLRAIAENDRWAIARRSTGPLLRTLLQGDEAAPHVHARLRGAAFVGLGDHPLTVVDDDVAILVGTVTGPAVARPLPVTAVLIASDVGAPHWLVASVDIGRQTSADVRLAAVGGTFSEIDDREVIAAAQPLDPRASAIAWDDPAAVLRTLDDGRVHTVAEMHEELAVFPTAAWSWLADEAPSFAGLYLRAVHPHLVREHDRGDVP